MASDDGDDMLSDVLRRDLSLDSIKSGIKTVYMTLDPFDETDHPWTICSCYYEETTDNQVIVQLETKDFKEAIDEISISSWIESVVHSLRNIHASFKETCIIFTSCSIFKSDNTGIYDAIKEMIYFVKLGRFMIMKDGTSPLHKVDWTDDHQKQAMQLSRHKIATNKVFFSRYFDASSKGSEYDDELKRLLVLKTPEEHNHAFFHTLLMCAFSMNAYCHFCHQKSIRDIFYG